MPEKGNCWKMIIAGVCVVLILAYAFIVFLPHAHGSCGTGCTVCALMESSKDMLIAFAGCAVVWKIINRENILSGICRDTVPMRDTTPVGLKVKFSD